MCVGWLVENKAQILERVRPNSSQFNLAQQFILAVCSMWTLVVFIWMGHSSVHLHVFFFKLRIVQKLQSTVSHYFTAAFVLLWFLSRWLFLCPGRVSMIFQASSRPKSLTLPCEFSESLYRHSQARSWSGIQVRGNLGLKRTPGNIKHSAQAAQGLSLKHAKSFAILTAFAQKNAASKPYHSYYAHSPTTHSGFWHTRKYRCCPICIRHNSHTRGQYK